jgi:predicted MFS family arabinose efflux permease
VSLLPAGASTDAMRLLETRGLRAFGDGLVSVVLVPALTLAGLSASRIGIVITATLIGSAAVTLAVGLRGYRLGRRRLLQVAALLMIATGIGFASARTFWPLLIVAFLGTMNPSAGDVSVFLPTEQALLPQTAPATSRTALFARYALTGSILGAAGSLAAGVPEALADHHVLGRSWALRSAFIVYSLLGLVVLSRYARLSPAIEPANREATTPLGPSRAIVYKLSALFSIDSFGGGFVVQALLALWLFRRFGLSVAVAGQIFFWTGLLSALSALVAVRIAKRLGLIRTMVYTHLPANVLLMATPLMPNLGLAIACLLARSALSQMDVPVRTSYVMAVVTPAERPAAASVTNVPRSLASAVGPFAAGWMLERTTFGWPLVIGGALKAIYDLVLLAMFRSIRPPEEYQ